MLQSVRASLLFLSRITETLELALVFILFQTCAMDFLSLYSTALTTCESSEVLCNWIVPSIGNAHPLILYNNVYLSKVLSFFFLSLFIYLERERERERENRSGRGADREGERIPSSFHVHSAAQRRALPHKPWHHDLSRSQMFNWLSHPSALKVLSIVYLISATLWSMSHS